MDDVGFSKFERMVGGEGDGDAFSTNGFECPWKSFGLREVGDKGREITSIHLA